MKKLNKKGFTLVELLVVLVILVVIMSIAIPSITSSLERSKDKQKEATIKLIVSAGELYIDRYKNSFDFNYYDGVKVETLISKGFLTSEEAMDPFTDDVIVGCVKFDKTPYYFDDNSLGGCGHSKNVTD